MDVTAYLALPAHRIALADKPSVPTETLINLDPSNEFVGRPYFIWRHNPEIARHVNERLSSEAL